ncbi:PAS domain-containing sensor histidine kinase [Pedobacter frigoris]|uniref:histidine kinase n=1 Tax=Pedobacter frigoris TaxID=2571272 RepID=A0A4U1CR86_9SPHI|nr:PAS domain-containing sensor histidine kinase [Pedobacter frigoris]TKC09430.1 PAS domain S-box protein [Pedobacter frigoris]
MSTPLLSFKNIISISPIPLAVVDTEMRYIAASEKWLSLYHLEDQVLIGRSHYEVFPEIGDVWKKIHADCLLGKDQNCENDPFLRADGTLMWLKWEVRHWLDDNGAIGGMMMSSEDVTHKTNITLNEKRFQLFMDELPGLCWIADNTNILKYANKCFFDTLRLGNDVIGKNYNAIFGSDIARNLQESNDLVLKSGEGKSFHQTVRDQHGHPQIYKVYKFPFIDEAGEGNMIGSIAFNVTKNKLLEEELYQSEAQFKLAFEHSLIGMALLTPDGAFKRVNRSLCDMLGYSEAEMKQLNIREITHSEDLTTTAVRLDDMTTGKIDKIKFEKRYLHKDGRVIWVVIAATMLYDSLHNPLYYVSQIEDITRRKEIENDLVLSEKKYRTIFENVQDVFYQTDQNGLVTEISPSIEQYSGYSRKEIIGQPVSDFYFYVQDRERIIDTLRTSGFVIDFEVRLKTKDKELRYASVNARLVVENGAIVATEGSMRDVTARKFHENELRALNTELTASNEQKNKLLSIIGHDLRNPISGSLQLLNLTLDDFASSSADEVHTYLSMMKQELSNANNLLEDLLTWAKSQFNAISFNPEVITDISGLFIKSIQTIGPMAVKKHIEIAQQVDGQFQFMADKDMLETIIRNLLANAIKFTHTGGNVILAIQNKENGVLFSVCDNGIGIPEEKIKTLFDKNTNYTTYGTSGEKGTGLGLSLCYDFVHKHGGQIWAESDRPQGTCFYFLIPKKDN